MSANRELWVLRPGLVGYEAAATAQRAIAEALAAGEIPDVLLLLEHPPVLTRGRRSERRHLPMGEDWYRMQGIEVCETDRGGQVTYHGPGQLVAYPIHDLRRGPGRDTRAASRVDIVAYVRALERVMIAALSDQGVAAQVFEGLTGVWTAGQPPIPSGEIGPQRTTVGAATLPTGEARKIGSIGIHLSGGIATHGLAINVNNDLQPFEWVITCGIEAVRMTSLGRELGREQPLGALTDSVLRHLCDELGFDAVEAGLQSLTERVPGAASLADTATAVR